MILSDSVTVEDSSVRVTDSGYIVAIAKVARGGNVQRYLGKELDRPDLDTVRVYRPESEVKARDTLSTFTNLPMTNDHPPEPVDSTNWKKYAVGYSGETAEYSDGFVKVPLVMMDANAVQDYNDGKVEISMGYSSDIDWTPGITDDGEEYDAKQMNIRNNHFSLVSRARAEGARIGDGHTPSTTTVPTQPEGKRMPDLKTVVVDGLSIETSEQGAQAIDKLQKQLSDAEAKQAELESTHEKALADKDKTIAERDAKIDELNKQVMTDEQLDAAVKERADLVAKAKSVSDADYAGKSPAEIRKAAVVANLGDEAVKDKSDAYIEARFDVLAEDADKADPVRGAMNDSAPAKDDPQAEYERQLQDGYKEASNG